MSNPTLAEQFALIEAAIKAAQTLRDLEEINMPNNVKAFFHKSLDAKKEELRKAELVVFEVTVASTLLWNDTYDSRKWLGNLRSIGDLTTIGVKIQGVYQPITIEKIEAKVGALTGFPLKGIKNQSLMRNLMNQQRKLCLEEQQGTVYILRIETRKSDVKLIRVENLNPLTKEETPYLTYLSVEEPISYTLLGVASGLASDLDQGFNTEDEALAAFESSLKDAKAKRTQARLNRNSSSVILDSSFENKSIEDETEEQAPPVEVEEVQEVV